MNLDDKLLERLNKKKNQRNSEFLRKKSSVLMFSGGVDSVAGLKYVLVETDDLLYVHHIHIKSNEGMEFERYKKESEAVRKIVPYMKKTFRNFNYTESTINVKQIIELLPDFYEEEDLSLMPLTFVTDRLFWGLISGLMLRITNSNEYYIGGCLEDFTTQKPFDGMKGYENWALEKQIKFVRNPATSAASYPHETSTSIPITVPNDPILTKRQSIEYIGEELMNMVWYCREPIEKDGEFVVCHECHSCRDVDNALSEKE